MFPTVLVKLLTMIVEEFSQIQNNLHLRQNHSP